MTSWMPITQFVLESIARHPDPGRRALADDGVGELSYAEFASVVSAAGAGLAARGVRPGDVGAVLIDGAKDFALALHALTTAGAVPYIIGPPGPDLARQLCATAARVLLTGEPLESAALEAADRAFVRQIFTFGEVHGAATPFDELLAGGGPPLDPPPVEPLRDVALRTRGPVGKQTHADRMADMLRVTTAIEPDSDDVIVASPARMDPAVWAGLIDAALVRGAFFVAVRDPRDEGAEQVLKALETHRASVAILDAETMGYAAYEHEREPFGPGLRVLTSEPVEPQITLTCRARHGWSIASLT